MRENYDEYRTEKLEIEGKWRDELLEWEDYKVDQLTNPWGD